MKFLNFFSKIGELKEVKRTGWLVRGIQNAESVSDHSFRLALLALVYGKQQGLDVERCVELALVHDLHEVFSGDIIWPTADEEKKFAEEKKGILELIKFLPEANKQEKEQLLSLWNECAEKKTAESKLVHDLDKIEMLLQVIEYKSQGKAKENLEEFFILTKKRLLTKKGLELWKELNKKFLALK